MIIQYVRDENYNPIGVVVATDKNEVGVSQCNPHDKFRKALGVAIAAGRAKKGVPWKTSVIHEDVGLFSPIVQKVVARSRKYFQ